MAPTGFPFGLLALVVAAPPRVPPRLPLQVFLGRQVRGERALQHVRVAAYGVRRVAVVRTLAVEAHVLVRRHEERLEQVGRRRLGHQLGRDVHQAAGHGHRPPEPQYPVVRFGEVRSGWVRSGRHSGDCQSDNNHYIISIAGGRAVGRFRRKKPRAPLAPSRSPGEKEKTVLSHTRDIICTDRLYYIIFE